MASTTSQEEDMLDRFLKESTSSTPSKAKKTQPEDYAEVRRKQDALHSTLSSLAESCSGKPLQPKIGDVAYEKDAYSKYLLNMWATIHNDLWEDYKAESD